MELSVIIPVYNERNTILEIVQRVQEQPWVKEIVIVDDCSTDGTRELLQQTQWAGNVLVLYHDRNRGKGASIRTAIEVTTKDIVIIQDADLEYNPDDYGLVLQPILDGVADVVYGSRILGANGTFRFRHYLGNRLLTRIANALYGNRLTDVHTCYKAFRSPILKSVQLKSDRFEFCSEITAKISKRGFRVYEVPIRYIGRGWDEGKKITWRDGFPALWALARFRIVD